MENYTIMEQIGRGGGGFVFLVRSKRDDKLYALKQIYLDASKKNRTKEAVMKEVNILSKLRHPNIVNYKESFFDDQQQHLCIVQDFCDGGTLHAKIGEARERKEKIPQEKIMQWFVQLALALQHIHSQKVLHRDLKSQNVFLTKSDVVKVGDFGISKVLDNTLDMAQTCVGTPYYLSPELCQDLPYNSKSDMWALGCLLYELCELRPAFNASSLVGLIFSIVKGSYMPISSRYSRLVQSLVTSLLSKSPDERPSAAVVLNMPEIKLQLSSFIQHKEASRTSEVKRPVTVPAGLRRVSKDVHAQRRRSLQRSLSPTESDPGNYSDDFDDVSSSDADECRAHSWNGTSRRSSQAVRVDRILSVDSTSASAPIGEDEYIEDFESDDSDEEYEEVLATARNALDTNVDEHFVADEKGGLVYGQPLKDYCAGVLGEQKFEEILDCFSRSTDLSEDT
eukprot:m.43111 g.43111  ORF g.43111 m.43111 type:complete len:451 (+) comp33415_c0_seq5:784-2136(+)